MLVPDVILSEICLVKLAAQFAQFFNVGGIGGLFIVGAGVPPAPIGSAQKVITLVNEYLNEYSGDGTLHNNVSGKVYNQIRDFCKT